MQATSSAAHTHQPDDFDLLAAVVRARFDQVKGQPLFTVDAPHLYEAYLGHLAADQVQVHRCNCCRRFIEQYGNLVTISPEGYFQSVMWEVPAEEVPEMYRASVDAMYRIVSAGKVSGVFLSADKVYGRPTEGGWSHFSVTPANVFKDRLLTPHQVMAAKAQDFTTLSRGISEFNQNTVGQAVQLLEAEALYRGEKVLGPARWLAELHAAIDGARGVVRTHKIWSAVATAPVGYCTPRSSMIGTLLEDLAAGLPFDAVKARFADKMDPTKHQRPQAPASAGNIRRAEQIVEQLGIAASLSRRHARLEDIQTIWKPKERQKTDPVGIFDHLKGNKGEELYQASGPTMTWVKFAATVLPNALEIEVLATPAHQNWCGLLTATDPSAPTILQWDHDDNRNPVSWYVWKGGSAAYNWGLKPGFKKVTGITLQPSMWNEPEKYLHQGTSVILLVDGAISQRDVGLGLYPEFLKSELHQVRATIEAHSNSIPASGRTEGTANGLRIPDPHNQHTLVRVTSTLGRMEYKIDRWD